MDRQDTQKTQPAASKPSGAKIPDKPRDCAPHVDEWPILDTEAGKASKPKPEPGT